MTGKDLVYVPWGPGVFYPTEKSWRIGEYYNEGGRKGVVFHLSGANHGMILSLEEGFEPFALDKDFEDGNPAKIMIETDNYSGSANQFRVSRIERWREKYPAFAWCDRLGKGWFLPTAEEAQEFLLDDNVRNAVNRTLAQHRKPLIKGRGRKLCQYWTSTESKTGKVGDTRPRAFAVNLIVGEALGVPKWQKWYVRAVGYF